ncbi:MAG TPA: hypothetical protein VFA57_02765 [Pseudolabrys sp.]|jgi:hypothetical protein|nr:hypothetical protein [Pseudolabrys sp.]
MDTAALAAMMASAQVIRAQLAAAAMLARMTNDDASSVVQVVNAAEHNMSNLAAGVGQNVNITV